MISYALRSHIMRTTLDINEQLLQKVMHLSHVRTKKQAVHLSMKAFIRQKHLERLAGRLGKGDIHLKLDDLAKMRAR